MIIEETQSIEVIKSVLCEPSIYDRITADNAPLSENWTPPLDGEIYLAGYANGGLVGIFNLHPINEICWECHVQVLPTMRDYAHLFGHGVIEWVWTQTEVQKLVAQIPVIYPDVIRFAETKGFEIEGINRQSHLKRGHVWDQVYMGLVRV